MSRNKGKTNTKWTDEPIYSKINPGTWNKLGRNNGLINVNDLMHPPKGGAEKTYNEELLQIEGLGKDIATLYKMKFQTNEAKLKQGLVLCDRFMKAKQYKLVYDVWLEMSDLVLDKKNDREEYDAPYNKSRKKVQKKHRDLVKEIKSWVSTIDSIKFQLNEMGDRLFPLNFGGESRCLDPWQQKCIEIIDCGKSLVVCAPTSSGKTVLVSYLAGKKRSRILVCVPTNAVATQVYSSIQKIRGADAGIVCDDDINITADSGIVIGTPTSILTHLETLDIESLPFDKVVIDEAHMMNKEESALDDIHLKRKKDIEAIIHLNRACGTEQVILLSATLANPKSICDDWLIDKFKLKAEYVKVEKRFFNLNRYVVVQDEDGKSMLEQVSVLSAMNGLEIDKKVEPRLTAENCVQASRALKDVLAPEEEIYTWMTEKVTHPGTGKQRRISLQDIQEYEQVIMKALERKPDAMSKFSVSPSVTNQKDIPIHDVLLTIAANSKMLPCVIFNPNEETTKHNFYEMLSYFQDKESRDFPGHQDELHRQNQQYKAILERRDKDLRKLKHSNARDEYTRDNPLPDCPPNSGTPHPECTFSGLSTMVSVDEVHAVLDPVRQYLNRKGLSEPAFLINKLSDALCRGMAIYMDNLPEDYKNYVIELAQARRISVIFSGMGFAHGVNLPVKTSILYGDCDEWTVALADQMAGRAGRRGIDKSGNTVYAGIPWEKVQRFMIGELPQIQGSGEIISPQMKFAPIGTGLDEALDSMKYNSLHATFKEEAEKEDDEIEEDAYHEDDEDDEDDDSKEDNDEINIKVQRVTWKLRHIPEGYVLATLCEEWLKNRSLCKRTTDKDEVLLMSVILRILDVEKDVSDQGTIEEFPERWDMKRIENLIEKVPEEFQVKLEEEPSVFLYGIYKCNNLAAANVDRELREKTVKRLISLRDVILTLRNEYRMTPMEELLRKAWRRAYWIVTTGCIQKV
jgi:hypothetical protein